MELDLKSRGSLIRKLTDEEGKALESSVILFLSHSPHFILELSLLSLPAQQTQNPTSYHHLRCSLAELGHHLLSPGLLQ